MAFDSSRYGPDVAVILALDGNGRRPMPLAHGKANDSALSAVKKHTSRSLFSDGFAPEAALSGLYLYFCGYDESHTISQDIETPEGSFWHGIMHRQEPDPGNAGYWFRRVGQHATFPQLRAAAAEIVEASSVQLPLKEQWDAFAFIDFCEQARKRPGSEEERVAMEIQLAEWQLLFDYCARSRSRE